MAETSWVKFNPNPDTKKYTRGKRKGEKVGHSDCVIRGFCKLFKEDWVTTYKRLCERGLEVFDIPNSKTTYTTFLKQNKTLTIRYSGRKQLTVRQVAEQTKGTRKTYLLKCSGHVVAICNGKYYDSWDSGGEFVKSAWELKDDEK